MRPIAAKRAPGLSRACSPILPPQPPVESPRACRRAAWNCRAALASCGGPPIATRPSPSETLGESRLALCGVPLFNREVPFGGPLAGRLALSGAPLLPLPFASARPWRARRAGPNSADLDGVPPVRTCAGAAAVADTTTSAAAPAARGATVAGTVSSTPTVVASDGEVATAKAAEHSQRFLFSSSAEASVAARARSALASRRNSADCSSKRRAEAAKVSQASSEMAATATGRSNCPSSGVSSAGGEGGGARWEATDSNGGWNLRLRGGACGGGAGGSDTRPSSGEGNGGDFQQHCSCSSGGGGGGVAPKTGVAERRWSTGVASGRATPSREGAGALLALRSVHRLPLPLWGDGATGVSIAADASISPSSRGVAQGVGTPESGPGEAPNNGLTLTGETRDEAAAATASTCAPLLTHGIAATLAVRCACMNS
mmetsp:Transcript_70052/g.154986  ORF Transcript_70052/g.154986 Transcript_70052/m.154986 type:complete len:430 (-) Transcript_70052:7-1296(-)